MVMFCGVFWLHNVSTQSPIPSSDTCSSMQSCHVWRVNNSAAPMVCAIMIMLCHALAPLFMYSAVHMTSMQSW